MVIMLLKTYDALKSAGVSDNSTQSFRGHPFSSFPCSGHSDSAIGEIGWAECWSLMLLTLPCLEAVRDCS